MSSLVGEKREEESERTQDRPRLRGRDPFLDPLFRRVVFFWKVF